MSIRNWLGALLHISSHENLGQWSCHNHKRCQLSWLRRKRPGESHIFNKVLMLMLLCQEVIDINSLHNSLSNIRHRASSTIRSSHACAQKMENWRYLANGISDQWPYLCYVLLICHFLCPQFRSSVEYYWLLFHFHLCCRTGISVSAPPTLSQKKTNPVVFF